MSVACKKYILCWIHGLADYPRTQAEGAATVWRAADCPGGGEERVANPMLRSDTLYWL